MLDLKTLGHTFLCPQYPLLPCNTFTSQLASHAKDKTAEPISASILAAIKITHIIILSCQAN